MLSWDSSPAVDALQVFEYSTEALLNLNILVVDILERRQCFGLSLKHLHSNVLGSDLFIMAIVLLSLHKRTQRGRDTLPLVLFLLLQGLVNGEENGFEGMLLLEESDDLVGLFVVAGFGSVLVCLHLRVGSLEGLEKLSSIESEHDEVVNLFEGPNTHDGQVQNLLGSLIVFKSLLDVLAQCWWDLVTFGRLISLEEDFDELAVVLLELLGLVDIKFQHLIDLGDSNHDTESESGKWNDFQCDLSGHDKDKVEIIIDSNEIEDLIEALEHQNTLEENENSCIVIYREHLNEERQKENDELG